MVPGFLRDGVYDLIADNRYNLLVRYLGYVILLYIISYLSSPVYTFMYVYTICIMYMYIYIYEYMYICIHINIYTHIYIHIYIYIYIYIYT